MKEPTKVNKTTANVQNAVRNVGRQREDTNLRTGRLVMQVLNRNDLTRPQKDRYLRMIRNAGRRVSGLPTT